MPTHTMRGVPGFGGGRGFHARTDPDRHVRAGLRQRTRVRVWGAAGPGDTRASPAKAVTAVAASMVAFLVTAAPVESQVVRGRVLDARTGEPVAVARMSLMDQDGRRVHTTLTEADGSYLLRAPVGGLYEMEADRLGYRGVQRIDPFEVAADGATVRDIRMVPEAVPLEGITVRTTRPGQILHEATMAGVYARRARSPSVGSNRVLVRGDAELDNQFRVREVLPAWIPRPFCPREDRTGGGRRLEPRPFVYYDGRPADHVMGPSGERFILDLPVTEVEAVEYYRDWQSAPMTVRPAVMGRTSRETGRRDVVRACGIVLVWSRGAR